jgi:uncharacterized protein (TIGR03435 family)
MLPVRSALLVLWVLPALHAQPAFEVASIRPSTVMTNGLYGNYRRSGGPGTNDPGRMILENYDIRSLIQRAYDIPSYLFSGPDWLSDIRFDVTATISTGTSKQQFLLMQQNLLATRLGLAVHREKREMPIYELIVAKGGSKLKAVVPPDDSNVAPSFDKDGFPVLLPGHTIYKSTGDHASIQASADTMEHLAQMLAGQLQAPVQDATGLTGKYDYTLRLIPGTPRPEDDPGLSLESALPQQLGLTLRHTKGQVEVLVMDHVEKTPTEN